MVLINHVTAEATLLTEESLNEELAQLAAKKNLTQADRETLEALSGLRQLGIEVPIIVDTQSIGVFTPILCESSIAPLRQALLPVAPEPTISF